MLLRSVWLFFLLSFGNAFSQGLPVVTVTASGIYDFGFEGYGPQSVGSVGIPEPFPGYVQLVAGAERYIQASNVRCSATGDLKNVTSQSSVESRWLAAEQVYRRLKVFDGFWSYWGRSNRPDDKGFFVVIYADGYEEQWAVLNPTFSAVTPGHPMPGTLKPGKDAGQAGAVQNHSVCG